MFGSVDADQDSFDHRRGLRFMLIRDIMARAASEPSSQRPTASGRIR
jgi:hypothetical protein